MGAFGHGALAFTQQGGYGQAFLARLQQRPMNDPGNTFATDEIELRRLCAELERISQRLLSQDEREALEKAALALSCVFLRGGRAEVERLFAGRDGPLTSAERSRLQALGIELPRESTDDG